MTGKIKGEGLLRHHFWGEYFATVGIVFASAEDAAAARRTLGVPWNIGEKNARVLYTHVASEGLELLKEQLASFGADPRKIDSCAKSIDIGEPWTIVVPVVAPEQGALFA